MSHEKNDRPEGSANKNTKIARLLAAHDQETKRAQDESVDSTRSANDSTVTPDS